MIYLVRHGETEFNRERRLQGHVDSALTTRGLAQARAVGDLLKGLVGPERGWRIVSSPLGRARRTAEIVAERLGLDPAATSIDPRLVELSWGEWDGKLRDELAAAYPETFGRTNWAFHAPTGETYEQMCARLASWLSELPREPERRIIAVSHGVTGRVLRGLYAAMPPDEVVTQDVPQDAVYRLAAGAITRIDCEPVA
jgi:probable phosphoglycerate mutase